jgi:hypothetical protein
VRHEKIKKLHYGAVISDQFGHQFKIGKAAVQLQWILSSGISTDVRSNDETGDAKKQYVIFIL